MIVSGAIGDKGVRQSQRFRSRNDCSGFGIAPTRENVEDDVGRMDAVLRSLGAGALARRQAVREHGDKNGDHLTIAVFGPRELAADALESTG